MKHQKHINIIILLAVFFIFSSCNPTRKVHKNNNRRRKEPPCDCPKIKNSRFKRSDNTTYSKEYYSLIIEDSNSL